ncbi:hypothetical protein K440DRAFT_667241 [Wilcoxina mikolae CBS 423.85]|nr:hypothetical protein K440DRAFT_667241 [Wilcoxina mikolae CBS 423.85]
MPLTLDSLPVEVLSLVYSSLPDFSSALNLSLTSKFLHAIYQHDRRSIHLSILRKSPLLHSFFDQSLSLYLSQHPNTPSKIPFDSPQTITTILHSAAITHDLANYLFDTTFGSQRMWSKYSNKSNSYTIHLIRDALYTIWKLSLNPTSDLSVLFEDNNDREGPEEKIPFVNPIMVRLLGRPPLSAVHFEEGPEDLEKKKNPFGYPGAEMKRLRERVKTYALEKLGEESLQ